LAAGEKYRLPKAGNTRGNRKKINHLEEVNGYFATKCDTLPNGGIRRRILRKAEIYGSHEP
jgi:hypothetical protein